MAEENLIRLGFLILGYVLGVGTVSYMARHAFKEYTNEVYSQYVDHLRSDEFKNEDSKDLVNE